MANNEFLKPTEPPLSDEMRAAMAERRATRDARRQEQGDKKTATEAIQQNADTTFSMRLGAKERMALHALAKKEGKGHTQLAREILLEGLALRQSMHLGGGTLLPTAGQEVSASDLKEALGSIITPLHALAVLASSMEGRVQGMVTAVSRLE
jgi:hypothetical protein